MTKISAPRTVTAALTLVMALSATACDNQVGVPGTASSSATAPAPAAPSTTTKATSTPTTARAQPQDYSRLLLEGRDISSAEDTYTAQPTGPNQDPKTGAEVLLVNQDQTKAVNILIAELPDPAAAPSALQEAQANLPKTLTGGQPQPSPVGSGGTVVSGTSPDGTKSVTVLLFTEGTALARIEFDGLPGQPASNALVTNVGQKQDIALRVGQAAR
ncbi:hypothetical protein [Mycobacterium sp. DL592]|uniref:hypothetical protein n=1 Tax=Mycobacterium sp. DL592 TaxID=2675524 RepID=UPI00141FE5D3|nr:hypothetical protein [Mycobacterium sp. DL592]